MTSRYKMVKIYVIDPDHQALKKKLARQKKSLSAFFREKSREYLKQK